MERSMVTDGTNIYLVNEDSLQKIVASTKVSTTLNQEEGIVDLTYGNSILYAATINGIYSVHVTTGVMTKIAKMDGITGIAYFTTTHIHVLKGNSLIDVLLADGTYTYVKQDVN